MFEERKTNGSGECLKQEDEWKWGVFEDRKTNGSGGVFEANCSKQAGQPNTEPSCIF